MTAEEVKAKQDALTAKGYNLGWWYGTRLGIKKPTLKEMCELLRSWGYLFEFA